MKKIAILQSNYIPWKGYFDMISQVDEFIIYDDVQFTKNDWRNRNKIKTVNGLQWISIPVYHSLSQKINEITVSDARWNRKHWNALKTNYSKAKYFNQYKDFFESFYNARSESLLSDINLAFIKMINEFLQIDTLITRSSDYELVGDKTERLVNLCKQAGAAEYLTGPAARGYLNVDLFTNEGITVDWMDYSGYQSYDQLFPPFEHSVSVLDLLFNTGPAARSLMSRTERKNEQII